MEWDGRAGFWRVEGRGIRAYEGQKEGTKARAREVAQREGNACCAKRKRLVGILSTRRSPLVSSPPELKRGTVRAICRGGSACASCVHSVYARIVRIVLSLCDCAYARLAIRRIYWREMRTRARARARARRAFKHFKLVGPWLRTLLFRELGDSESEGIYCERNVSEICEGGWMKERGQRNRVCIRELLLRERIYPAIAVAIWWHCSARFVRTIYFNENCYE